MGHLIRLEGIYFSVGNRSILEHIDLQVSPQKILTIIGPNGAGKTSLVRLLLGLQKPSAGVIWRAPGLRVGYTPQMLKIDPLFPCTVKRFLEQTRPLSLSDQERLFAQLSLKKRLLDQPLSQCSGGELQRILLVKALLADPQLLVLDEPAQGVDVLGQSALYELILQIRQERQCAIVLISHDLHVVMAATDEVLCLNRHICCHGSPHHVAQNQGFLELFGWYQHHHQHRHD